MTFDCTSKSCGAVLEVPTCGVRIWCPVCEAPMQLRQSFENPGQLELPHDPPGAHGTHQY